MKKDLIRFFVVVFIFSTILTVSCKKEEKANQPPTCKITAPANGEEVTKGDTLTISVETDDSDGSISEVRFFIDGVGKSSATSFPYNYNWNTGNESMGNHTIKATSIDNNGSSTSDEISVTIIENSGAAPVADFTATPTSGTAPLTVTFTDQSVNTPTSWQWDFGDGNTSTQQNPTHIYNNAGTYTVNLTATNEYGSDSETKTGYITVTSGGGGGGGSDLEWVNVSGGTFQMGSNDGDSDEQPIHTVTLSSFEITKYEVTNGQFSEFLNSIGCSADGNFNDAEYGNVNYIYMSGAQISYSGGQFVPESGKTDFPVIYVSWYGAHAFALWAGGRLPTEAEWEFAARGGNNSNGYTYSGSNTVGDVAWYDGNSGNSNHQVGTKAPNELGIYDMSGNVWEWCNDWYDSNYYSSSPQNNPQGPSSGTVRVLRGGSWNYNANNCRVALRYWYDPVVTLYDIGFRVAR